MAQASIPQWEVNDLVTLSAQNKLSGIPPWALAGMAENESGGEVRGAGIDASSGDGGYFGDSQSVIPASTLLTSSKASFDSQAQTVAGQLAAYRSQGGVLGDVAIYNVGGGGSNGGLDWQASQDAVDANALSSGTLTGTSNVGLSGGGNAAPLANTQTGSTAYNVSGNTNTASIGNLAQLPSPGILSWITDPIGSLAIVGVNATITALLPVFFFVLGLILVAWGLSIVAHGSPNITVQSPQPSGGLKKDVEHGGEDAAAGAAVAA